MDPDLEVFLRRPAKQLKRVQSVTLDDTVNCCAISPEAIVAVGQADTAAIALFSEDLSLLRELAGHAGGTNALSFGSSSKLVSAGEDGTAAVWDAASGDLLTRLECEGENVDKSSKGHTVSHAVCNAAGTLAACAAGRTLHVFGLDAGDYEGSRRVFPAVSGGVIDDIKFVGNTRLVCAYYGGVIIHSTEPGSSGVQLEYGTNVLAVAATPDLSYIVGGCMDSCVHIWHFLSSPEAAAAARSKASGDAGGSGEDEAASSELVEFSCGGYMSKVTGAVFNAAGSMLSTLGGTQCTVWDFTGPNGPAGTIPVVGLGHTKTLTCQAWQPVPRSPILVTGGKDGRVLVYDVTEYAEPPEDDMPIPKFSAPAAVAPGPDLRDEVTALVWSISNPTLLYAAHASGELRCWLFEAETEEERGPQQDSSQVESS